VLLVFAGCEKTVPETERVPQFFLSKQSLTEISEKLGQYILYISFLSAENGVSMIMYDASETGDISYSIVNVSDSGNVSVNEIYNGNEDRSYCGLFYDNGVYTVFYKNFGSGEIDYQSEKPLIIDTYDSDFNLLSTVTSDIFSPLWGNVNILQNGDYYYICVNRKTTVTRYDKSLKKIDSIDYSNGNDGNSEVINLVAGSDGNVYVISRDNNWDIVITAYDSEKIPIKDDLSNMREYITGQGDYLFFCYDNSYIYGILPDGTVEKLMMQGDLEDNAAEKLFNSVTHNGVYKLYEIEAGEIIEYNFTLKAPEEDTREKLTITVIGQVEEDLIDTISNYNRTNLEYRLVIDEIPSHDYQEVLNKKILDNTLGDIIIPPRFAELDRTYTDKGVYEDLYAFLDSDDEFSREDFFPNVLSAMEIDGHLYGIWRLFTIQTYFAPKDGLPPTYENVLTLQNENPDLEIIPNGWTNLSVLQTITEFNRGYFDSAEKMGGEAMRQALLIANKYPSPKEDNGGVYVADADEKFYYHGGIIPDLHGYIVTSKFRLNTEAVPVGNPIPEGEPQSYINPGLRLCVSAASDNKDAAWDFVKFYLKIPFGGNGISGMPTLKRAFDEIKTQELTENAKLIAEYGADYSNSTVGFGSGESYKVPLATEEDYAALEKLIASSIYPDSFESELLDIISEEAEHYFSGQKSIDEVLSIIKNRADLYIAEKS
jgi:ABC-type glycerol-3-phosphate transport system substrate-binding protein